MGFIDVLEADVEQHGEVHAHVEEHDDEVEIRLGTTEFDRDNEVLRIETADTERVIGFDRIVSYYLPTEFYH